MSSSLEIPARPRNGRCGHDKRDTRGVICRADPSGILGRHHGVGADGGGVCSGQRQQLRELRI
ncbi:MAG: hypothetical protein ABW172_13150 [Candidatus Binatia bacterium]